MGITPADYGVMLCDSECFTSLSTISHYVEKSQKGQALLSPKSRKMFQMLFTL